jgi:hypothetical protein
MSDHDLLKLAAKAAGIVLGHQDEFLPNALANVTDPGRPVYWNPLDDDGDGARLEAALGFDVTWGDEWSPAVMVGQREGDANILELYASHSGDKQAARRRAAVRAAAEMGKGMA